MAPLVLLAAVSGCGNGAVRIKPPSINANSAAAKAIELYDTNGDGTLDSAELEQSPGLKAAMKTVDTDGDGQVSESEIADRIKSWQATKAGICVVNCFITLDKRPLEAASITFEPESFLGDQIRTAIAYTDSSGAFSPSIPKKDRPSPEMPFGIQLGFFKIRVSKEVNGKETIPAIYNSATTLGQQVATDDPAIIRQKIVLNLKSR